MGDTVRVDEGHRRARAFRPPARDPEDAITEDEEDMLDLAVNLDWEMAKTAAALRVFMKGWESYG